jgi:hypothetical protein
MKQVDSMLHSSGRRGGDSLVLERPAAGVLQNIPIATDCMLSFLTRCGAAGRFRLFGRGLLGHYTAHDIV